MQNFNSESKFMDSGILPNHAEIFNLLSEYVEYQCLNINSEDIQVATDVIIKAFDETIDTKHVNLASKNPKIGMLVKMGFKLYDKDLFDAMMVHVKNYSHENDDPEIPTTVKIPHPSSRDYDARWWDTFLNK